MPILNEDLSSTRRLFCVYEALCPNRSRSRSYNDVGVCHLTHIHKTRLVLESKAGEMHICKIFFITYEQFPFKTNGCEQIKLITHFYKGQNR